MNADLQAGKVAEPRVRHFKFELQIRAFPFCHISHFFTDICLILMILLCLLLNVPGKDILM
jgi:hypothetical protein